MLESLNNRDKIFRQSRILTIICVVGMILVALFSITYVHISMRQQSQVVYALIGEEAVTLGAVDVMDNRPVEAHAHIKEFHQHLFRLDPDREVIDRNLVAATSMADNSVQSLIDTYEESNYYRNLISGNVSQSITMDSIYMDMNVQPHYFRYVGEMTITRPTSIVTRTLIAEGNFRDVQRSRLNPHGYLIERYRIVSNDDIDVKKRYN